MPKRNGSTGESPVATYRIKLARVITRSVHFEINRSASEEYDRAPKCQMTVSSERVNPKQFEVRLSLELEFGERDQRPFDAMFTIGGVYTHLPGMPDDLLDYFEKINGPLMLWPYMRELVASVTTRAGFPALVIETLDTSKWRQEAAHRAPKARQDETSDR